MAPRETPADSGEVLRAKYLDYCSAQVADALLSLSADEMYVLARSAAGVPENSDEVAFGQVVEAATRRISAQLSLPSFEEWLAEYQADPERFDRYLMGFWESEVEAGTDRR